MAHVQPINRNALVKMIFTAYDTGRALSVTNVKKDGTDRIYNIKPSNGLKAEVKGDLTAKKAIETKRSRGMFVFAESVQARNEKGQITGNVSQWRTINTNTITSAKIDGTVYVIA